MQFGFQSRNAKAGGGDELFQLGRNSSQSKCTNDWRATRPVERRGRNLCTYSFAGADRAEDGGVWREGAAVHPVLMPPQNLHHVTWSRNDTRQKSERSKASDGGGRLLFRRAKRRGGFLWNSRLIPEYFMMTWLEWHLHGAYLKLICATPGSPNRSPCLPLFFPNGRLLIDSIMEGVGRVNSLPMAGTPPTKLSAEVQQIKDATTWTQYLIEPFKT